jgi:hypothetical protein
MKKLTILALAALAALPMAALAQGGQGPGPGAPAQGPAQRDRDRDREKLERRMRLARTLGLAEALDLDAPQALKLGDALGKFDDRRVAAQRQLRDAHRALRDAADAEKPTAQEVDQAIQKALDARAQLAAIDRETLQVVSKDLSPAQRARAVLFLDRFGKRFRGLGPDPDEIRHVIKRKMGRAHGEPGHGRGMAFRMGPPGDPQGLETDAAPLPPPPEAFLFGGGDDDDEAFAVETDRD